MWLIKFPKFEIAANDCNNVCMINVGYVGGMNAVV